MSQTGLCGRQGLCRLGWKADVNNEDAPIGRDARFSAYIGRLARALGHADRAGPLHSYCLGMLLPGERKSVEPTAARVEPDRAQAAHQSLHHFVAKADWSDEAMLTAVYEAVCPVLGQHAPICTWGIGEIGFSKKGVHSVGVARQNSSSLEGRDNCQVAVTLSLLNGNTSLPIAYRLYLPEEWAADSSRRHKAGVPEGVKFRTKSQIALEQIAAALAAGMTPKIISANADYGADAAFRAGVSALGLPYIVGVEPTIHLRPPDTGQGGNIPPSWARYIPPYPACLKLSAKKLARSLPARAWDSFTWQKRPNERVSLRFTAVRVRPAHHDHGTSTPQPSAWLLVEWPENKPEPTQYWLATLPTETSLLTLACAAKASWYIENDLQRLKKNFGLGHYEGRGWRGFHHHATLCIAAYGFSIIEKYLSLEALPKN